MVPLLRRKIVRTPLGQVIVGNPDNDRYEDQPVLLLINVGGEDHYGAAGQNQWPLQAVSQSIDVRGNDTYSAGPASTHSFGAGMCGIGLLFDMSGDDRYRLSAKNGCGSAHDAQAPSDR